MRMNIKACFLLVAILSLASPCVFASDPARAERACKRFSTSVEAFHTAHYRYPRTLTEHQGFASTTRPLDLVPFSKVEFQYHDQNSLDVTLHNKSDDPLAWLLGFHTSVYH